MFPRRLVADRLSPTMKTVTRAGSRAMTSNVSSFVDDFMARVEERNPHEPEFLQAVREVVGSLVVVLQKHPEYRKALRQKTLRSRAQDRRQGIL